MAARVSLNENNKKKACTICKRKRLLYTSPREAESYSKKGPKQLPSYRSRGLRLLQNANKVSTALSCGLRLVLGEPQIRAPPRPWNSRGARRPIFGLAVGSVMPAARFRTLARCMRASSAPTKVSTALRCGLRRVLGEPQTRAPPRPGRSVEARTLVFRLV